MYHIQEITKKPSVDILSFFYELSREVCTIGIKKRKNSYGSIYKKIDDFFPGTSVPFNICVRGNPTGGRYYSNWHGSGTNHSDSDTQNFTCSVDIGFPDRATYMEESKLKDIETALVEQALLGGAGVHIADFVKPEIKASKMFKDLMDTVAGRPVEEKKRKVSKSKI